MGLRNFGLNDDSINYEVALEKLGQSRHPFMRAIREEMSKPEPSQPFVNYCKARLLALDDLQDALQTKDKATIERILAKDDPTF